MELKSDYYWNKIFVDFEILKKIDVDGSFIIKASQLNKYREARLLVKFDQRELLPKIFKDNRLSILPLSRNSFIIAPFDAYYDIDGLSINDNVDVFKLPENIETIDYENIYSEGASILCAFNSGMLNSLVGEELYFTVNGRMSTQTFKFDVLNNKNSTLLNLHVNNSTCEIDGGFEGQNSFTIIEAKNYKISNFIIRQLYYPYRLWKQKIKKNIKLYLLSFSNDIFTFYNCQFNNSDNYNSIQIIETKKFMLEPREITLDNIIEIFNKAVVKEDDLTLPFPQADDFYRIVDLLNLLYDSNLSKEEITLRYEFNERQTHYYATAGRYLGLVNRYTEPITKKVFYSLTTKGKSIIKLKPRNKYLSIIELILEHEVFNKSFKKLIEESGEISKNEIIEIMQSSKIKVDRNSLSTLSRRASTISSWLDWIMRLTKY